MKILKIIDMVSTNIFHPLLIYNNKNDPISIIHILYLKYSLYIQSVLAQLLKLLVRHQVTAVADLWDPLSFLTLNISFGI